MSAAKTTSPNDEDGWHGEEWEPAIQLLNELEARRFGAENAHPIGRELEHRWGAIWYLRERADSDLTLLEAVNFCPAIMEAGAAVINAWLKFDVAFFKELARRIETASGNRKKGELPPLYETIIDTAFNLFTRERGNPTKQEVRAAVEKLGFQGIDWTKAWKKCRLTFLKNEPLNSKGKKRNSSGIRGRTGD